MIAVTRHLFASTACMLALCAASAPAQATETTAAAIPAAAADPLDDIAEPVAVPEPELDEEPSAIASDLRDFAPLAGGIGAGVGVVAGTVVGVGSTYVISMLTIGAPTSGAGSALAALGQLVAPMLYLGMPVLGAGLGAFAALALVTDTSSAALGGVAAAVTTPLGAVAGGVAGVAIGVGAAYAFAGGNGWAALGIAVLGGVVGTGLGAIAGAATGGAGAAFAMGALE